jgi:hypothetical protein
MNLNRRPSLIRRVAQFLNPAIRALRAARHAEFPPMPDHFVRKVSPAIARNNLHQIFFNLSWVFVFGQFEAP